MTDTDILRIAVAQIDATMGDISGNAARIRATLLQGAEIGADLIVFPELSLCGAKPGGLALDRDFLAACRSAAERLAATTSEGPACLIGSAWSEGDAVYNAALLLAEGRIAAIRYKANLDAEEADVFAAGPLPGPIPFGDTRIGVAIGQDIEITDVCECLAETGADVLVALDAAAYRHGLADLRLSTAVARVVESGLPLLYVNAVGGQDEFVFDGASFALGADRRLAMQYPAFQERVRMTVWRRFETGWQCVEAPVADTLTEIQASYAGLVLGLRGFARKNRCTGLVLELRDDAPSALLAALAVDAVGADQVYGLILPSAPSASPGARAMADHLSIRHNTLPLSEAADALERTLGPLFEATAPDAAEDHLRARLRGALMAAVAEKFGGLALAATTRTDLDLGTLQAHADLRAGFAPLKDLEDADIPALARLRNGWKPADAQGPEGDVIAPHLTMDPAPPAQAVSARRIMENEGLRRRAAPGTRLRPRAALGRYPITNRFPEEE